MSHESKMDFRAKDGKDIFCQVDFALDNNQKSNKAIVMVHGLTGYPYTYAFQVAARYFVKQGYDVYRPALYWAGENNRSLKDCTTSIHTKDIQSVVDVLRNEYKSLFVAGHSLAGTSLIGLSHVADAYSFWDCDYSPWDDTWSYARYHESLDAYFVGWGSENLICKEMVEEARNTTESNVIESLNIIQVPSQVIVTEFGQASSGEKIFSSLQCRKEFKMLVNAGHTFVENDSAERLAKATFEWFKSF